MESGPIVFQIPRDEQVKTLWKRMVLQRRYLQSLGLYLILSALLWVAGPSFLSAAVVVLIYPLTRPWVIYRVISRAVAQHPMLHERKTLEFNADGVTVSGTDWRNSRSWRHFKGWQEDPRYFYLEISSYGVASIIPKLAMSSQQQELLRGYLTASLARTAQQ